MSGKKAQAGKGRARGLTPKQRLFALAYLETMNAAEAYRMVYGATGHAAEVGGSRLLRNAEVAAFIREKQAALEAKAEWTVEQMDRELETAARFDPIDTVDPETGATLPLHLWPERARRALAGWEEEALFEMVPTGETGPRGGEKKARVQVGVVRKFKLHNKTEAKKLWYQRRGALVERQEVDLKGQAGAGEVTDEEWAVLAKLEHEVRHG